MERIGQYLEVMKRFVWCAVVLPVACGDSEENKPVDLSVPVETFSQPREISAADGVVELTLQPTEVEVGGKRLCLRAYGELPGPTIRVADGEERSVRVNLKNAFTKSDYRKVASQDGQGEEHCYDFNLTNLHAHGLHVQPEYAAGGAACESPGCADTDGDGAEDAIYFADNVLNDVPPGGLAKYRWDLDQDDSDPDRPGGKHWPGTHWYHPHIHGSTTVQLMNGAAGMLVVEGNVDQLDAVNAARERVMVLSQIPYDVTEKNVDGDPFVTPLADGEPCDEDHLSINNFLAAHHAAKTNSTLNGKISPVMVTAPGQVERWRLLHAGMLEEMWIGIFPSTDDKCSDFDAHHPLAVQQFAADGIALPRTYERDFFFMSPGYRIDLLVPMPTKETTLCLQAYRSDSLSDLTKIDQPSVGTFPARDLLAIIRVHKGAGEATSTRLLTDAELATVAPPVTWKGKFQGKDNVQVSCDDQGADWSLKADQKVVLVHPAFLVASGADSSGEEATVSSGGSCDPNHQEHSGDSESVCTCPLPNLNCRLFHPRRMFRHTDAEGKEHAYRNDRVFVAGTTELWDVTATDGHPFHIHINPFVVCPAKSERDPPFAHWRDTYFVEFSDLVADDNKPRRFLIRHADPFVGSFVQHCHKITHEDEGMMELIEVCRPGDTDCLCLMGQTVDKGTCVTPNAGCFEDDVQCLFAEALVATYSPGDYATTENASLTDLSGATITQLRARGLDECLPQGPPGPPGPP
ncbi:MAG: multicopper oxidase domain-containing protein [Myxococcales bacterium]|nr:multicopper oxidase domain-containing protein [Myxococcales bacterium]